MNCQKKTNQMELEGENTKMAPMEITIIDDENSDSKVGDDPKQSEQKSCRVARPGTGRFVRFARGVARALCAALCARLCAAFLVEILKSIQ